MFSYFEGKRIVITGASGYLASNLVYRLQDSRCTIVRLSRKENLPPIDGKADVIDIAGDICERDTWEQVMKNVNIVYHFAAQTSVYVAHDNPLADWLINVAPMLHLLETCREKHEQPVVIFSGTVTEVGIPKSLPVDETHDDQPVTIYDLHKLMAENYLKYYAGQGTVQGTILRLANVYGPGPKSSSADRAVINMMMRKALKGEALTIYGTGEYLRDYIFVEDVISAFLKAPACIEHLNGKHFVLGSGEGVTIARAFTFMAERVTLKIGKQISVEYIAPPAAQSPIEARNFVADTQQFASATGWQAQYSLIDGIDHTLEELRSV